MKILFIIWLMFLSNTALCQDYWLIGSSFFRDYEYFSYSKKTPDYIYYGLSGRGRRPIDISILAVNKINDSLISISLPECLRKEETLGYTVVNPFEDKSVVIKEGELKDFLMSFLAENNPMFKPVSVELKNEKEFRESLIYQSFQFYKLLLKKCK